MFDALISNLKGNCLQRFTDGTTSCRTNNKNALKTIVERELLVM
jgi:hypothetical protein